MTEPASRAVPLLTDPSTPDPFLPPLPYGWHVGTFLPTLARHFRGESARWPRFGDRPIATFETHLLTGPTDPAAGACQILLVETQTLPDVAAVAGHRDAWRRPAVVFVPPAVDPEALRQLVPRGVDWAFVTLTPDLPTVLAEAGRVTERLVRRRVVQALLVHWHAVAFELALACDSGRLAPRRSASPLTPVRRLDSVRHSHVCGAEGLWWAGAGDVADDLGLEPVTERRLRARLPGVLEEAIGVTPAGGVKGGLGAQLDRARRVVDLLETELRAPVEPGLGARDVTDGMISRIALAAVARATDGAVLLGARVAGVAPNTWRLIRPRQPRS